MKNLDLNGNGIMDCRLRVLAASSNFNNMISLDASYNAIGSDGMMFLSQSPFLSSLIYLDLRYNRIRDAGARTYLGGLWVYRPIKNFKSVL